MSSLFNETDDDVTLPQRSAAPPNGRDLNHLPADREYTLNTGVVLALFFALALLCAVFFGFGYSIGHKSAPVPAPVIAENTDAGSASLRNSTGAPKPSPGTVAVPEYVPPAGSAPAPVRPTPAPPSATSQPEKTSAPAAEVTTKAPAPVVRVAPPPPEPAAAATVPAGAPGSTMVQIAAVSHPEDADVLLSTLRRRGYSVQAHTDSADHLIHIQIGPFGTRKEADAMRQKLLGDGYNSILK